MKTKQLLPVAALVTLLVLNNAPDALAGGGGTGRPVRLLHVRDVRPDEPGDAGPLAADRRGRRHRVGQRALRDRRNRPDLIYLLPSITIVPLVIWNCCKKVRPP